MVFLGLKKLKFCSPDFQREMEAQGRGKEVETSTGTTPCVVLGQQPRPPRELAGNGESRVYPPLSQNRNLPLSANSLGALVSTFRLGRTGLEKSPSSGIQNCKRKNVSSTESQTAGVRTEKESSRRI